MKVQEVSHVVVVVFSISLSAVSGQFILPNHPFAPPAVDPALGFSRQRSPCPGLNVLANHGFIHRNGSAVTFRSVAEAAEKAFGIDQFVVNHVSSAALSYGFNPTRLLSSDNEKMELAFNLFDFYVDNVFEAPGRIFRQDEYYKKFAQFNQSIFDAFIEAHEQDGLIAVADLANHRVNQVRKSRKTNPEATYAERSREEYTNEMSTDLTLIATFEEKAFPGMVSVEFLRYFFQENRLPVGYIPRQLRGFPLASLDDPGLRSFHSESMSKIEAAIRTPMGYEKTFSDNTGFLIGISVSAAFTGILVLLVLIQRKCSKTETETSTTTTTNAERTQESFTEVSCVDAIGQTVHSNQFDQRYTMTWEKLSFEVSSGFLKRSKTKILSNVSGSLFAGQITGIVGHSGSGKSTLLNILAGRHTISMGKSNCVQGMVKINGQELCQENILLNKACVVAFVGQEDSFLESVTPWEAIRFSARLRLPQSTSEEYIKVLTSGILADLKLIGVQDRIISRKDVLSGGEKRRVSLGLELVSRPRILLLDEITSGLDSHSARVVMEVCSSIAGQNDMAIAMAIHQPNSTIFSMMDRLVIMKNGCCMYEGDLCDVEQDFANRDFPRPSDCNTADWILDVSQENSFEALKNAGFFEAANAGEYHSTQLTFDQNFIALRDEQNNRRVSMKTEIVELFKREALSIKRDPQPRIYEVGMIFALTLLVSLIFEGVGKNFLEDPEYFSSHVGVVFTVTFSCVIMAMISVTYSVKKRLRFSREYITGHYRIISYGVVMMVFEFCFLFVCALVYAVPVFFAAQFNGGFVRYFGILLSYATVSSALGFAFTSLFDDANNAQSQIPLVVAPQLLFSGFIVTQRSLSTWIRWAIWTQPLTYAYRLMLNTEFAMCQDFTSEEKLLLQCATSVKAGLTSIKNGNLRAVYDDESVLTVMQAGQYIGGDAILEYFTYFSPTQNPSSLLWNYCSLQESDQIIVNEVGDGFCDITIASVFEAQVNPRFTNSGQQTNEMWNFVNGFRLILHTQEDLSGFKVRKENLFLPPRFVDFYDGVKPTAMSSSVCQIHEQFCPNEFADNNYTDIFDCIEMMESLPLTKVSSANVSTVDSNSTGCRQLHSSMAVVSPEIHCPHLSFRPMKDINNKTKCSQSSDYAFDEYFSDEDFVLFQHTAQTYGMSHETFMKNSVPKGTCADNLVRGSTIGAARGMPDNMFCYSYLETQHATDDDGLILTYWLALLGFLAFYSVGGLFLLRRRALYSRHH